MTEAADTLFDVRELPFLTATLPGVGGKIKVQPDDFVVEEIPAYEPCGSGEHLFLQVEKRDLSAEMLTRHIARSLNISQRDVGVAGLKDRRAVTRQWISVAAKSAENVSRIETNQVRVLQAVRHQNKLRTGHLQGNRFEILIREVCDGAETRASQIVEVISQQGCPNYYGSQRFGYDNQTLVTGLKLLCGEMTARDLPADRRRFLLKLSLSSVQSYLFNHLLAERIRNQRLHTIEAGEVMQVVASGGPFVVTDVSREQQRFDEREVVPAGPLWGPKMKQALGTALEREEQALAELNLSAEHFAAHRKLMPGTRRPLLIWPADLKVQSTDDGLLLRFTLPPGVYATMLLREIQKNSD